MKTMNFQNIKSISKRLISSIFLIGSIALSSYKSSACTASFTYSAGLNGHYSFTGTYAGYGPGLRYSWNAGDGSGWQNGGPNFTHLYVTNNTFTVQLAANDSLCYDTATVVITVSNVTSPCILSASYTYTIMPYGYVDFTSTSTGTVSYTQYFWSPGDSNQTYQGTTTFTHQYAHPGMYLAWLKVIDTGSAYCSDSIPNWVNVTTVDTAYCHIHASFTYVSGSNGQITFTNTSTGTHPGDTYTWGFGDTTSDAYGIGPVTHTYLYNGTYDVKLRVTDDTNMGGCYDSIIVPITITNACNLQASFTITYDTLTDNGQVTLTSTTNGANLSSQYYWTPGDGSPTVLGGSSITFYYPFNGNYTASLVVVNSGGCQDSTSMPLTVTEKDSLQACFTYISDSLNAGQYDFNASCSKGTNSDTYYKWTWGDSTPSDSGLGLSSDTHTYSINGPYAATLTIWYTVLPTIKRTHSAGRFSESSVTDTIHVTTVSGIKSITDASVYNVYPNPNNGSFRIAITGLTDTKNAQIRITNLMGQMVYQNNEAIANGQVTANINLPNATDGIYLLQITTAGNNYNTRIAIQK